MPSTEENDNSNDFDSISIDYERENDKGNLGNSLNIRSFLEWIWDYTNQQFKDDGNINITC